MLSLKQIEKENTTHELLENILKSCYKDGLLTSTDQKHSRALRLSYSVNLLHTTEINTDFY